MSNLQDLLERVEKAEGRDYALDFDILRAVGVDTAHYPSKWPLTSSLDGTLALVKRVLPGWGWCMRTDATQDHFANVFPGEPNVDRKFWYAYASTPALALLAALLRALIAQQSDLVPTGGEKEGNGSSISQSGCTTFGRNETPAPSAPTAPNQQQPKEMLK